MCEQPSLFAPPTGLAFVDSNGERIKLSARALLAMVPYVQTNSERAEAGGVLMGRFLLGNDDVVVDAITVPHRGDRRTRLRFFRLSSVHQSELDRAWVESAGTCNYLGEWHTHAEAVPEPSPLDKGNWLRKLRDDKFDGEFLCFVIVGTRQLGIWKARRSDNRLEKLKPIRAYARVKATSYLGDLFR